MHRPLQSPLDLIIILATLVAACSASVTPVADGAPDGAASSDCLAAFEAAAAVSDVQDTHEDLYPAFDACADVDEFAAASDEWPDALDGAGPASYVQIVCDTHEAVSQSSLCGTLGS